MTRKKIITGFFDFLETKFKYAIIHHVDEIFQTTKDIDFVVACKSKREFVDVVTQYTLEIQNLEVLNVYRIDNKIYRIDLLFFEKNNVELIELDASILQKGEDLLRINSEKLLLNREKVEVEGVNFYKVSNLDEYEYYVSKKAFKKDKIKNHFEYLKTICKTKTDAEIIEDFLKHEQYYQSFGYDLKRYRNKFLLLLSRLKNNPLLTVAFLGPDGSGKTTIINKLTQADFFRYTPYFHLKPLIAKGNTTVVENPHGQNEYSKIVSIVKLVYFVFQYNFGWIKNILKYRIKSSLVIFDRYYFDLLADPKRYRYSGSKKAIKFFGKFIPKPDLIFVLIADAEVIYNRKQEVERNELKEQLESYKSLHSLKNTHLIYVDKTVEDIFLNISLIVSKEMQSRHKFNKENLRKHR